MENYYVLLGLDRNMPLEAIKRELAKQATVYSKRRDAGFSQAEDKLNLIERAETVFLSEQKRKEYDEKLFKKTQQKAADPNAEKLKNCFALCRSAYDYYTTNALDLAEIQIGKAMKIMPEDEMSSDILRLAAIVFGGCKNHEKALNLINRCILIDPHDIQFYMDKLQILAEYIRYLSSAKYTDTAKIESARLNFKGTAEAGSKVPDRIKRGKIMGFIAYNEYFQYKLNIIEPISYAEGAKNCGENYYSKQVLDDYEAKEKKRRRDEEIAAKRRQRQLAQEREEAEKREAERLREQELRRRFAARANTETKIFKTIKTLSILFGIIISIHIIFDRYFSLPFDFSMLAYSIIITVISSLAVISCTDLHIIGAGWNIIANLINMIMNHDSRLNLFLNKWKIAIENKESIFTKEAWPCILYSCFPFFIYFIACVFAFKVMEKHFKRYQIYI